MACSSVQNISRLNNQYKPLSTFKVDSLAPVGSDTADYLKYNFIEHKDKYIGKTFEQVMKEVKLDVYFCTIQPIYYDRKYCEDVLIRFYNPYLTERRKGVTYYLVITFKDKFDYKELDEIQRKDNFLWSKSQYDFLKKRVVKDIILGDSRDW
jgi:hypothetical protein